MFGFVTLKNSLHWHQNEAWLCCLTRKGQSLTQYQDGLSSLQAPAARGSGCFCLQFLVCCLTSESVLSMISERFGPLDTKCACCVCNTRDHCSQVGEIEVLLLAMSMRALQTIKRLSRTCNFTIWPVCSPLPLHQNSQFRVYIINQVLPFDLSILKNPQPRFSKFHQKMWKSILN